MTAAAALSLAPMLAAGCAQFDDSQSAPFSPVAGAGENFGEAPEPNKPPDMGQREPSPGQGEQPDLPPQTPDGRTECEDPDPAVIATCRSCKKCSSAGLGAQKDPCDAIKCLCTADA